MRPHKDNQFGNRLQNAKQAKQALLKKFESRPGPDDPEVKERLAKRKAIAEAREERARQREAEKVRLAAEEAERKAKEEAELEAARERELQEHIAREAEKKAQRDARYAARKKRKK